MHPVDDITAKNIQTAIGLDHAHDHEITRPQKVAIKINDFAGSISFLVIHALFFIAWMALNSFHFAFDKYPFTLLNLFVSLESIFLSSLVLIAQNRISAQQDTRYKLDLQINLLAEQENTIMMRVVDRIAKKVGVDSSELEDYLDDTDPEKVFKAIEAGEKKLEPPPK